MSGKNADISKTQGVCHVFYIFFGPFLGKYKCAKFHYCSICRTDFRQGMCITASGNILASWKISLKHSWHL